MSDFTPLTPEDERRLRGLETWMRLRTRFELREVAARAVIRLTGALGATHFAKDAAELRRTARLLRRQALARDALASLGGARRSCDRFVRALRRALDLGGDA